MEVNKDSNEIKCPSLWCVFISCCPCFLGLIRDHDDMEIID